VFLAASASSTAALHTSPSNASLLMQEYVIRCLVIIAIVALFSWGFVGENLGIWLSGILLVALAAVAIGSAESSGF
jgi:hypothetical protein